MDAFATRAPSEAPPPKRTIKDEDAFVVCDPAGDADPTVAHEAGFYLAGTRHLSHVALRIHGLRPLVLFSAISPDGGELIANLTNPDAFADAEAGSVGANTVFVQRRLALAGPHLSQSLYLRNFAGQRLRLRLSVELAADFADIFEVRGLRRARRGGPAQAHVRDGCVELRYRGLDGVLRVTVVAFDPAPRALAIAGGDARADFALDLDPREVRVIEVTATAAEGEQARTRALAEPVLPYETVRARRRDAFESWHGGMARIRSSHEDFNRLLARSLADLRLLTTSYPEGPYPAAGIPWYVAPFGRDGCVTALELLWLDARLARGVLRFLAAHQAGADDPFLDAEPGKVLHELRRGELANLREIPFLPYYGSADATPLFLCLLGAYVRQTGDLELARELWRPALAALAWIDGPGDLDGDGFVEYRGRSPLGLSHQGWKDSRDAIFHADGADATGAIALVEVQGYVYAARRALAQVAARLGHDALAAELVERAARLAAEVERAFWWESAGSYVLALDGDKRPCRVVTSNAGHLLWAGLARGERAARVAAKLMGPSSFSGWGIRTVADSEPRYNPMSYHNGSVWPHDNALVAAGLKRYGHVADVETLATALLEASLHFEGARLPELFCGFHRVPDLGPTQYPVSCSPQAWAAAAPLEMLRALLGLEADAPAGVLSLNEPTLPRWMEWVEITGLTVGPARVDLRFRAGRTGASLEVLDKHGPLEILVRR